MLSPTSAGVRRHGKLSHTVTLPHKSLVPEHLRVHVADLPWRYNLEPLDALMRLGSQVPTNSWLTEELQLL